MPKRNDRYKSAPFDMVAEQINSNAPTFDTDQGESPFVVILGPSGIGKSHIIKKIEEEPKATGSKEFQYIKPYTTRKLRSKDEPKIHVPQDEFDELEKDGAFLFVKELYGNRYGTPNATIVEAINNGETPILDFPLEDMHRLQSDLFKILPIYLFPKTIMDWYAQISNVERNSFSRLKAGYKELKSFISEKPQEKIPNIGLIAFAVINNPGLADETTLNIIRFLDSLN